MNFTCGNQFWYASPLDFIKLYSTVIQPFIRGFVYKYVLVLILIKSWNTIPYWTWLLFNSNMCPRRLQELNGNQYRHGDKLSFLSLFFENPPTLFNIKKQKMMKLFPFGIQYSAILSLVPHSISLRSTAAWFPPTPARLRPHHHLHRRQNGSGERESSGGKKLKMTFFRLLIFNRWLAGIQV